MDRFTLDLRNPPNLTDTERLRMEAMTDGAIAAAAETDGDNPPLSAAELARLETMRLVRSVRAATGLSQPRFAAAFRISPGRLRDLEQGRTQADSALVAYLTVIAREPEAVRRALVGGDGMLSGRSGR